MNFSEMMLNYNLLIYFLKKKQYYNHRNTKINLLGDKK